MLRWLLQSILPLLLCQPLQAQQFTLAPALALEAEDFTIESGWKVVQNGRGNYMVDCIGFNHISGEKLLCIDAGNQSASAYLDVEIPETGKYRLWVRYEYPAFCETRFRAQIVQNGQAQLDQLMGTSTSKRFAFGDLTPRAQHDPSWGPEGLMDEPADTMELKKGRARIYLKDEKQQPIPGVAAGRHIDCLYLTRDLDDAWMKHYGKKTRYYPILDAFRDSRGPRWEVQLTNQGQAPASFSISHVYNRVPWGETEGQVASGVAPGASTGWIGLARQDTTHFGLVRFTSSKQPFRVSIRPVGGKVERELTGTGSVQVYLPPYPGKGDHPVTPEEQLDAVLTYLKATPAPGKKPTKPLCYGGWMPLGLDNDYGRKYAALYAALGFRSLHPAHSGPDVLKNLKEAGIEPTKSWAISGYRNFPTKANIETAKTNLKIRGMERYLLWFDYGDEIGFSEWLHLPVAESQARAKEQKVKIKEEEVLRLLWQDWLKKERPKFNPTDYWLEPWGPVNAGLLRPDSSAAAAAANPRLYVDSLLFYENTSIAYVADRAKEVRDLLGGDVLCGANYSCHPFYYPSSTMYIRWFRGGAADMGRHSEYFWQVAQAGPMINGYITEHFRSGLRYNPRGVIRQYTMPHSPGNTDASFLRSCFSHLAHGARMLDFFGIGMNETFTENHIDHRDKERYRSLRDVTHAVGLVEDLLPESQAVASPVALLVSESTERWDLAGIARDRAGHDAFGSNFRKTRLNSHLERLGLWQALTFAGVSPDLLIEEDITPRVLEGYKVLIVVGDSLPEKLTPVLDAWVNAGGVVLATANSGRFDSYRKPNPAFQLLFGLQTRRSEERESFFRPRQELPFLKPHGTLKGAGWQMPQLGTYERVGVDDGVEILARFADDGSPAFLSRKHGRGRFFYVAALPGVASLWSALQPPLVPDRGPHTHSVPTAFDTGARALVQTVLQAAAVEPLLTTEPGLIDARVLKSPGGYVVPLANYNAQVGQKVVLRLRLDGDVRKAVSAFKGELALEKRKGTITVTIPALGYGDVLRLTGE